MINILIKKIEIFNYLVFVFLWLKYNGSHCLALNYFTLSSTLKFKRQEKLSCRLNVSDCGGLAVIRNVSITTRNEGMSSHQFLLGATQPILRPSSSCWKGEMDIFCQYTTLNDQIWYIGERRGGVRGFNLSKLFLKQFCLLLTSTKFEGKHFCFALALLCVLLRVLFLLFSQHLSKNVVIILNVVTIILSGSISFYENIIIFCVRNDL